MELPRLPVTPADVISSFLVNILRHIGRNKVRGASADRIAAPMIQQVRKIELWFIEQPLGQA
jgi:hypothetical protein